MHELSIILSIVDRAAEVVQQNHGKAVGKIELEIGELAGIEWTSFDFAWEPAVRDSVLSKAKRVVHRIPGIAVCSRCEKEFQKVNLFDPCPECGEYLHHLKSGKELRIRSITIT